MEHPPLKATGMDLEKSIQVEENRGSPAGISIPRHSELYEFKRWYQKAHNEYKKEIKTMFLSKYIF